MESAPDVPVNHEHVFPRKWLVRRLLTIDPASSDFETFLDDHGVACVVTVEEHAALGAATGTGWMRYVAEEARPVMGGKVLTGVVLATGLVATAMVPATMMASVLAGETPPESSASLGALTTCTLEASDGTFADLDEEQVTNARTIVAVGKSLDVPPRRWVIAIATALQESGLRNLDYGDRDSLGMMQQRPSMGWGTQSQVQDPTHAARAFFGGPDSPTRNSGLLYVPGWEQMPVWEAAQTVQRSAFPYAYGKHETAAHAIVERLTGVSVGCDSPMDGSWRLPLPSGYTLTSSFGHRRGGPPTSTLARTSRRPQGRPCMRRAADGSCLRAGAAATETSFGCGTPIMSRRGTRTSRASV